MSDNNEFLRGILDTNKAYAHKFAQSDPGLLKQLAKGQSPKVLWLGCSDSRVSAELSTGVLPGSIFVHRNVANRFDENDPSAMSAFLFAINVLKIQAIIVCGHTGCGGVKAALAGAVADKAAGKEIEPSNRTEEVVGRWIAPIKSLATEHIQESRVASAEDEALVSKLTDQHVANTVKAIAESQLMKDVWAEGRKISVHGWVYHVGTAKLRDLDVGYSGINQRAPSLSGPKRTYEECEQFDQV
ncbi:BZ3500_MvSof-1268-A1-R1_Chr1-2g01372 [Microbotryum saponariae]|uniref:Carbonic anhydrase n=1 Tax=Microbotryum saponariae TaxID=289078 RepID=A0A2X0KDF4_9BASI|nr:BZ3500_MvSof-1268-A1-R1_Chr1-2g01372 [Microbotryum saponariae]SCZ97235.1 BZ3501_MvSof-1269-A2-R1_Chr1-2g00971 [Microbotryum saponariae]